MKTWLLLFVCLSAGLCSGQIMTLIENFEDVSDWSVAPGGASDGGAIIADAGEAQVGAYAGAMTYSNSTAVGFDYCDFQKSKLVDLSTARNIVFKWKAPVDATAPSISMFFYSQSGGFLQHDFPAGDGNWSNVSLSFPGDFSDYGSNPNLSDINLIRIRVVGDGSATASTGTIYIDQLLFETDLPSPLPAENELLIEDFEDVSDWSVNVGSGANSGSISVSSTDVLFGSGSGKLDYDHPASSGFDYIRYTKTFASALNMGRATNVLVYIKQPPSPDNSAYGQLRFSDSSGGFLAYDFPGSAGLGEWTLYTIPISSFVDYGSNPDLSDITSVRFTSSGDAGSSDASGSYYLDQLTVELTDPPPRGTVILIN